MPQPINRVLDDRVDFFLPKPDGSADPGVAMGIQTERHCTHPFIQIRLNQDMGLLTGIWGTQRVSDKQCRV